MATTGRLISNCDRVYAGSELRAVAEEKASRHLSAIVSGRIIIRGIISVTSVVMLNVGTARRDGAGNNNVFREITRFREVQGRTGLVGHGDKSVK